MWTKLFLCLALASGIAFVPGCPAQPAPEKPRNPAWATPVASAHLKNFFKVNDILYRGAQPTKKGMEELAKLGVKSIINLRSLHSDADEIGALPLKRFHITSEASDPEEKEVVQFLKLVADPANHPVFVHCAYGSDRTGLMVAVYRIVFQGWRNEDAYEEMVEGGYGFHTIYKDIRTYVRTADAKALREKAGLPPK
jgi:tyrosine-protein phosphatase SIW14